MTLKKAIDECNRFIWEHQYPGGHHFLVENSDQHRDLIRTFFAGYFVAASDEREPDASLTNFMLRMTAESWQPGPDFARRTVGN